MLERILGPEAARALTIRENVFRLLGLIGAETRPAEPASEAARAASITARVNRLLGL